MRAAWQLQKGPDLQPCRPQPCIWACMRNAFSSPDFLLYSYKQGEQDLFVENSGKLYELAYFVSLARLKSFLFNFS